MSISEATEWKFVTSLPADITYLHTLVKQGLIPSYVYDPITNCYEVSIAICLSDTVREAALKNIESVTLVYGGR